MPRFHPRSFSVTVFLLVVPLTAAAAERHIALTRVVANVEEAAIRLNLVGLGGKLLPTPLTGDVWYGRMARRLPDDDLSKVRQIPFAVEYRNGHAQHVVVDRDLDLSLIHI